MAKTLLPIGSRVLVLRGAANDKTKSGLILPDMSVEKPLEGEVIQVGWSVLDASEHVVRVGDIVMLPKFGGTELTLNGKSYTLIDELDILGVLIDTFDCS
jgi:chaperonin GroES